MPSPSCPRQRASEQRLRFEVTRWVGEGERRHTAPSMVYDTSMVCWCCSLSLSSSIHHSLVIHGIEHAGSYHAAGGTPTPTSRHTLTYGDCRRVSVRGHCMQRDCCSPGAMIILWLIELSCDVGEGQAVRGRIAVKKAEDNPSRLH
jgi:hypothetical protein